MTSAIHSSGIDSTGGISCSGTEVLRHAQSGTRDKDSSRCTCKQVVRRPTSRQGSKMSRLSELYISCIFSLNTCRFSSGVTRFLPPSSSSAPPQQGYILLVPSCVGAKKARRTAGVPQCVGQVEGRNGSARIVRRHVARRRVNRLAVHKSNCARFPSN